MTIGDQPWFVGSDLLEILFGTARGKGHSYDCLDATETSKVSPKAYGLGQGPSRTLVSESGFYKLVMRSDKHEAKEFQNYVTKEILPSIRKTGSFVTGQPSLVENPQMDPLDLMMAQAHTAFNNQKTAF